MRRERIAYLCLETPRLGSATHTHVFEIIDGLRKNGWFVELFATTNGGYLSAAAYLGRVADYLRIQWKLMRQFDHYDVIYMRSHFAAFPTSLWARIRGRAVVQEVNGQPGDILVTYPWMRSISWLLRQSYRLQMRWAARVIVVTDGLRRWAETESGHKRIQLITNGANTDVFRPDGLLPDFREPYVVFVGGITAWHGIDVMIDAVSHPDWPKHYKLVIVGDGREAERFHHYAGHLDPLIMWLGRLPQEQAAIWLRGASAALSITQDRTGHLSTGVAPLKLFEAMASGVPVIVTNLPFQSALVEQQEAGLVIPMGNPGALAQAVAVLAGDTGRAMEMGKRGSAYVREHASWSSKALMTSQLVEELVVE